MNFKKKSAAPPPKKNEKIYVKKKSPFSGKKLFKIEHFLTGFLIKVLKSPTHVGESLF